VEFRGGPEFFCFGNRYEKEKGRALLQGWLLLGGNKIPVHPADLAGIMEPQNLFF